MVCPLLYGSQIPEPTRVHTGCDTGSSSMNWSSPDGSKRPACKFLAAGSLSSGYYCLLLWLLPTPFTHLQKKGHLLPRGREGLCKWHFSLCHLATPRQTWALPRLKLPGWIPNPAPWRSSFLSDLFYNFYVPHEKKKASCFPVLALGKEQHEPT